MRQTRRRLEQPSVVNGMVDLVADQLDSALDGEVVQGLHFVVGNGRARGMVRAVRQDQLRLRIGEPHDLGGINPETVLPPHAIKTRFQSERFRERRERSESRQRQNHVSSGVGSQPHDRKQRLGRASHDLHGLYWYTLHFADRMPQAIPACHASVDQIVVQEALAGSSSARARISFTVVGRYSQRD